jgi:hypothetical protein
VGGHQFSRLVDTGIPGGRMADLRVIGLGQGHHPGSGDGLGQALGSAFGDDQVGVVQQPVDGRGGQRLGHDRVEAI